MLYVKSKSRLIFAHININSIRNKFEDLKLLIQDKVDILVATETKLDDTFTSAQFYMEGFKTPIRLDRNSFAGGIVIYIRENIPSKFLEQLPLGDNDEGIFVELNLRNSKWVLFGGYSPSKEHISPYLKNIEIMMNKFVNDYDNIIMMGDTTVTLTTNMKITKFLSFANLSHLQILYKHQHVVKTLKNDMY